VTLAVHPLCGEAFTVITTYGRSAAQVETADGYQRQLPLAWTSLVPRPDPLAFEGHVVRLAPEGLYGLACWVEARADRAKLDLADREDQKPEDDVGKVVRTGAATAAVVGKTRAPRAQRRSQRKRGP
jgi:hypothetical protein